MSYFDDMYDNFDRRLKRKLKELDDPNHFKYFEISCILLSAGGKYWEKKGTRIYISQIWKGLLNAKIEYNHVGLIKYFSIDGEKWSLSEAKKLIDLLKHAYYDVNFNEWVGLGEYEYLFSDTDKLWNRVKLMKNR